MRIKLDAALDFLKSLKGQDVEIGVNSLTVTCDALRSGQQTLSACRSIPTAPPP